MVQLAAVLVHRVHQRRDMLRGRELGNAVTEIEDVSAAGAVGIEDGACFLGYFLWLREKRDRIEIALQRHLVADAFARRANVGGPVQADRIAADCSNLFQPLPAALGEHNARDARSARGSTKPG